MLVASVHIAMQTRPASGRLTHNMLFVARSLRSQIEAHQKDSISGKFQSDIHVRLGRRDDPLLLVYARQFHEHFGCVLLHHVLASRVRSLAPTHDCLCMDICTCIWTCSAPLGLPVLAALGLKDRSSSTFEVVMQRVKTLVQS